MRRQLGWGTMSGSSEKWGRGRESRSGRQFERTSMRRPSARGVKSTLQVVYKYFTRLFVASLSSIFSETFTQKVCLAVPA